MFLAVGAWSGSDTVGVALKCEGMKEGIWRLLLVLFRAGAVYSQVARAKFVLAIEETKKWMKPPVDIKPNVLRFFSIRSFYVKSILFTKRDTQAPL